MARSSVLRTALKFIFFAELFSKIMLSANTHGRDGRFV